MRFLLSVDTEADFWKYIQNPFYSFSKIYQIKWRLNKIRGKFIYAKNRQGLKNLVTFFKENQIPATFNITGHLYLKSCNGWPHFNELKPKAKWFFKKNWYYWDPKSGYSEYPGLYLGDFIEKEMKNNPLFDLGIHGFAHECWPLEESKIVDSGIRAAKNAANKIGVSPVSCSSPFNITEDKSNPSVLYSALRKNGFKIIRYTGLEDFPKKMTHKFKVIPPFKRYGLTFVHVSSTFDGTSKPGRIKRILKDIEENANKRDKNAVYCLCCHDFTFKSLKNLKIILNTVLKLKKKGKIELINMRDLLKNGNED
ncbi:MAG: hypothetical protein KJ600_05635 [Nanoarchaeota archaeon]|nr:hypothetical protein [Nanoarchaeota archaeon]